MNNDRRSFPRLSYTRATSVAMLGANAITLDVCSSPALSARRSSYSTLCTPLATTLKPEFLVFASICAASIAARSSRYCVVKMPLPVLGLKMIQLAVLVVGIEQLRHAGHRERAERRERVAVGDVLASGVYDGGLALVGSAFMLTFPEATWNCGSLSSAVRF